MKTMFFCLLVVCTVMDGATVEAEEAANTDPFGSIESAAKKLAEHQIETEKRIEQIRAATDAAAKIEDREIRGAVVDGLLAALDSILETEQFYIGIIADIGQAIEAAKKISVLNVGDDVSGISLAGGKTYEEARISKLDAAAVTISHSGGIARLRFGDLSSEWKARFPHDAQAAASLEATIAADQAAIRAGVAKSNADAAQSKALANATVEVAVSPDVALKIKAGASEKWPGNFQMQEFEIEKQTEAFLALQRMRKVGDVPSAVIQSAIEQWKDNYTMVVFEIENQMSSRRAINR